MTVEEARGRTAQKLECLEDIKNAPTIEAIPLEWLHRKWAENIPDEDKEFYSYELWDSIDVVLQAWQRENEEER